EQRAGEMEREERFLYVMAQGRLSTLGLGLGGCLALAAQVGQDNALTTSQKRLRVSITGKLGGSIGSQLQHGGSLLVGPVRNQVERGKQDARIALDNKLPDLVTRPRCRGQDPHSAW